MMLIRPPLWYRAIIGFAALLYVPMLVISVIRMLDAEAGAYEAFMLFVSLYIFVYFAWISYLAWMRPPVRLGSRTLKWRPAITWRYQKINLDDIIAFRMQDSYDLRLRMSTGDERSVHLSNTSRRERQELLERLQTITAGGQAGAPRQ